MINEQQLRDKFYSYMIQLDLMQIQNKNQLAADWWLDKLSFLLSEEKCQCVCHISFQEPYEHEKPCCKDMNGFVTPSAQEKTSIPSDTCTCFGNPHRPPCPLTLDGKTSTPYITDHLANPDKLVQSTEKCNCPDKDGYFSTKCENHKSVSTPPLDSLDEDFYKECCRTLNTNGIKGLGIEVDYLKALKFLHSVHDRAVRETVEKLEEKAYYLSGRIPNEKFVVDLDDILSLTPSNEKEV